MWFYFTSAERKVIVTIALVVAISVTVGNVIKTYPFLKDLTNLLESPELYPKVNLNKASYEELLALPCIGDTTAQAIIDYRAKFGPFNSVEALTRVDGISTGNLAKFKMYLRIK